jgi:hypothetical protein
MNVLINITVFLFWIIFLRFITRAGHRWLTPVIIATQEAEIRRIMVQSQPGQAVLETLS